jgi:hypothetical protein
MPSITLPTDFVASTTAQTVVVMNNMSGVVFFVLSILTVAVLIDVMVHAVRK